MNRFVFFFCPIALAVESLFLVSAFAASPYPLDRKELRIDYESSVLTVPETGPRRIVLSDSVADVGSACERYQTIERTYIGCSVPQDGSPNNCVTTFQECASYKYFDTYRIQKIVLKFRGARPRAGTEIRLTAKDNANSYIGPRVSSNDPCLKFEVREGRWPLTRKSPLVLVRNTCD